MMRQLMTLALTLALASLMALAIPNMPQAQVMRMGDQPQLVVDLESQGVAVLGAFVQQQLILHIQVISPAPFSELTIDMPELDGVSRIALMTPKTAPFATWGAKGHRHERLIAIFPERGQRLILPPIKVSGRIEKGSRETMPFSLSSAPIEVELFAPDPSITPWLVGSDVMMQETWSKDPMTLIVGDVVQRVVTLQARDIRAEQLPELQQRRTPGIGILALPAIRRNEPTRQGIIGHLEQTFEIRIESNYPIHISPISLDYAHTEHGTVERTFVPAYRIEPLPPDIQAKRQELMSDAMDERTRAAFGRSIMLSALALLLTAISALALWPWLLDRRDRQFKRTLANTSNALAQRRAVQEWGFLPTDKPIEAVRQLDRHLFAENDVQPSQKALIANCLGVSRQARIAKLMSKFERFQLALLGPKNELMSPSGRD